ncbi:MAG TPA: toll/interleukin-1 receptor domain-containing protein [Candidatus Binatia bacterium]|nr:toll/interleukin-1 receptor domain-containing protein [Candidatus Binatia bacterium]
MADIFISYANEDRDRAGQLAALLEHEGWSVWWDRRIPAGRTWRSVLEGALDNSRCMIVLWSENSVNSPWVAEEAEEARRLEKTRGAGVDSASRAAHGISLHSSR